MRSPLGTLLNKAPVPYVGRMNLSAPFSVPVGRSAQLDSMSTVGTMFSIVHRLSNATSQVEWHLYRKAPSGADEDREEVTSHAALDLWLKPNPWMPRQEFVEVSQQHLDLTGEAWWVISRNPRSTIPLELWPVRPDRMAPVPDPADFLVGYTYSSPTGAQIPLATRDVIFLRTPSPTDSYRGSSPVASVLTDIDSLKYSAAWNRNFFLNSAEPSGVVEVDRRLDDTEFNELRARWAEQHRGVAAAHRVAILENGLKWVDRSYSQRDMQFTELRQVSRDEIREAFGIPKFALGMIDDVNRATAEASAAWFARYLTTPRLKRIKGALNHELLPLFGDDTLEFDYENPVPEDWERDAQVLTARSTAAKALVDAGYDPTAVLDAVGLPEIDHTGVIPNPSPPAPGGGAGLPSRRAMAVTDGPPLPVLEVVPARLRLARAQSAERRHWERRLDALLEVWHSDVAPGQFAELAGQVEHIVDQGTPGDLASMTVDTTVAEDRLTAALFAQATDAAHRTAQRAAGQGVAISPAVPGDPDTQPAAALELARPAMVVPRPVRVVAELAGDLRAAAKVAVASLAAGLIASAARAALRAWAPSAKGSDVAHQVTEQLDSLTDATLKRELGGSIWAAENEGLFSTLELAEAEGRGAQTYVATEVNDDASCGACKDIDGTVFTSLDDAEQAYPFGGYVDCEGGINCRGSIEPSWEAS